MNYIQKDKIIKIIEMFYPHAKIYFFGSRAGADYSETSDLDIAIDAGSPMPLIDKAKIFTMIDALNMPQKTDVVDFHRVPLALQENILKYGILWANKEKCHAL
jgi:predicted nucleotidyltransferase